MKGLDRLRARLDDLQALQHVDSIPTTDRAGKRTWITGQGCGIHFYYEFLKITHDAGGHLPFEEMPENMQKQIDLWSRAEVDDDEYGGIARANRGVARRILGVS